MFRRTVKKSWKPTSEEIQRNCGIYVSTKPGAKPETYRIELRGLVQVSSEEEFKEAIKKEGLRRLEPVPISCAPKGYEPPKLAVQPAKPPGRFIDRSSERVGLKNWLG